jgi:hypothetical protein
MVAGRIWQVADLELQSKIAYRKWRSCLYGIHKNGDEMHVAEVLDIEKIKL